LTDKGEALVPLIEDMRSYGREWLGVDEDSCTTTGRRPAVAAA
jgi:DNA-binding HxlR family transcriptional regulator